MSPRPKFDSEDVAAPMADEPAAASAANNQPVLASTSILRGRRQVWIAHGQELYALRETRSGKLILTK